MDPERMHRRGRCPHRPAGYDAGAVRLNGHVRTVSLRADEGIGPYVLWIQNACIAGAMPTRNTPDLGLPHLLRHEKRDLQKQISFYGAGDEARTRYLHLGKVALYRMS